MKFLLAFAIAVSHFSATALGADVVVACWNCEWLFDDDGSDDLSPLAMEMTAPSRDEYEARIAGFAAAIATLDPDVIALEEIEDQKVVQDLANKIAGSHHKNYQVAFIQGKDTFTEQDVAFLVKQGWALTGPVRFDFSTHAGDAEYKDLSKHAFLSIAQNGRKLNLVAIHLNTQPSQRIRQSRTLRAWTQQLALQGKLIVLGDTNSAVRFNETTPTSDIGVMRGFSTQSTNDDLFDCHQMLGGEARKTHVGGRELDRILVSADLKDLVTGIETHRELAIRGDEDGGSGVDYEQDDDQQDLSDHFPLVARLNVASADHGDHGFHLAPGGVSSSEAATGDDSGDRLARLEREVEELKAMVQHLLDEAPDDSGSEVSGR